MNTHTETKHTPGPWRWHDELILAGGDVGTRQGKCIAESPGCFHWETDPEKEANAYLIAGAPDLLHACREMLNEIRAYNGESEFEVGSPVKDWCDMLKLAIAKATGDPKDFAQLSSDIRLSPEEEIALKASKPASWKGGQP